MTAIGAKYNSVICVLVGVLVIQTTMAQRAPFAGSRPANGLNQKDKYHTTTAASPDVQNRFGDSDAPISNQIPYGQTQKPPVGFVVVSPESTYAALQPNNNNNNRVSFEDRFGDSGSNVVSSSGSAATPTSTATPVNPLDAHGDQQLIDQLSKLPEDQQPFWFVNHRAIEAQRNGTVTNFAGAVGTRGSFFG